MYTLSIIIISHICTSAAVRINNPRIAVIGGGIGGCSASYFINDLFENNSYIDVYEAGKIGGRLATLLLNNRKYETGGAIIHSRNHYMVRFLPILGLKKRSVEAENRLGLFDGHKFVVVGSNYWIVNLFRFLWKYGFSLLRLSSYINVLLSSFEKIYELQAGGRSFTSVSEMLLAMDHKFSPSIMSAQEKFKQEGFSDPVIDELILSIIRCNYGQGISVPWFVGSVAVAGAEEGLWAVHGGNYKVAQQLLNISGANYINKRVSQVTFLEKENKFNVTTRNSDELYDMVIIAAPLASNTHTKIKFTGFKDSITIPGRYQRTVATIIEGHLNHTYFNYSTSDAVPNEILTVNENLFFISVGRIQPVEGNSDLHLVWKVFSSQPLNDDQLSCLFVKIISVNVIDWLAYPHYGLEPRTDKFILSDNLFYINAIEWAASAMEMSVIGAKNVALLAHQAWIGNSSIRNDAHKHTDL